MMNLKITFLIGVLVNCSLCVLGQTAIEDLFRSNLEKTVFEKAGSEFTLYNYEVTDIMSPVYGLELYYIKIPHNLIDIQVKVVEKNDEIEASYFDFSGPTTLVLLSGGFHKYEVNGIDKSHHGLVVKDSEVISKVIPWKTGGVIFQTDDIINIDHISEYTELVPTEAIQSKPILVKDAKNDIYSDDHLHHNRVAIGFTTQDELLVCVAFNQKGRGISSFEFAEILIQNKKQHHPNGRHILAMDGGPASHLYIPEINKHMGINSMHYIPNILEIKIK